MELANFWSWFAGSKSRRAADARKRGRRCTPTLQTLEDRSLLNGYIAVGAGAGAPPLVTIRVDKVNALNGQPPNPAGQPPAPGSDGRTDYTSQTLAVYDSRFLGGVHVASGNFDGFMDSNGDGVDDRPDYVVTAPGAGGGPHIKVWEMTQDVAGNITFRRLVTEFMAYDTRFVGGVNVTTGDLDGDGKAELILGAGPGGGPHVKIYKFDFSDQRMVLVNQFMAYDPSFRGGVSVASNMGYQVQTQYRQFVGGLHPAGFDEVPYDPPESRPGFNADPALNIPLSGTALEPTTLTFQGYFTVASGPLQWVGGNLLNAFGNLAYEPNVDDPDGNIPPEQPLVYATWAETDTNIPPFAVPDVVYGPFVQLFPAGVVADQAVVQPFSAAPGQVNARNQLITGPGPGGGPVVRVRDFVNDAGGFRVNEMIEFNAFDPANRSGINVAIGDFVELPNPDPFSPFVRPDINGLNSTQIQFPYQTDVYRQYGAEIMVTTASGGFQSVMFSDYNPIDPFTGKPDRRTNLAELNLVPTFIDTIVVPDPGNPLGGFFSVQDLTLFGGAIDPQFRGQIFTAASALGFDGTATGNLRSQNVYGAGANPNNAPSRGTTVRIFDNMGPLPFVPPPGPLATPTNTPVDQFQAFLSGTFPNGIGGISYGFGTLPMPGRRVINLAPLTSVQTDNNPVFIDPAPPAP